MENNEDSVAQLSFKIKFEEIWDFNIIMLDWQVDDIKNRNNPDKAMSSFAEVTLTSGKKKFSNARSVTAENNYSPNWNRFLNGLLFRGTLNELLSKKIHIYLYEK